MAARTNAADSAPSRRQWDAVAAIVAALIGFLALVVSGYTAYVQRQQVRAQVWPWIVAGNNDLDHSLEVLNKGAGPAIIRSVQVFVDGKPRQNWDGVLDALGMPKPRPFQQSTINPNVLMPGEHVTVIKFPDEAPWRQFRTEATDRVWMNICFCSSLDDCWMYSDKRPVGYKVSTQLVNPIDQCPRLPDAEIFNN
ncbi:MAG: hypothetical protein ABW186_08465 [Rhodanobacteraceae bacterium]